LFPITVFCLPIHLFFHNDLTRYKFTNKDNLIQSIKEQFLFLLTILVPFSIIIGIYLLLPSISDDIFNTYLRNFLFSLGILAFMMYFFMLFKDLFLLRNIKVENSRSFIEDKFLKFNTGYFRLKFIKAVQNQVIICNGEWSDGKVPNKNDEASTLLAKLEEKWLGL
jgi:hypothetical protein